MRRSAILRSSTSSMFPVPLNSSKITSSMREPVSVNAVATIVSEPPPSMLRAEPKNRLGLWSALASTPPERIFPDRRARSACDHFGHFLGPLVDQQHDDRDLRMILGDRVSHLVKQDCLSRARGRHDNAALTFANRCHDVDDAHAQIAILRLEAESLIGILRAQVVERNAILGLFGIFRIDALDFEQREVPFPRLGRPYLSTDLVSRSQAESLYLRRRDVD